MNPVETRLRPGTTVAPFCVETLSHGSLEVPARGIFGAPSNPIAGGGGHTGLPADFLIGPDGLLLDVHYGTHADDQWSVDFVLERARAERLTNSV